MNLEKMNEMLDVQGSTGNWDYDNYMHGLYNGMEFMMSMAENRDPKFREAPKKWKRLTKFQRFLNKFKKDQSVACEVKNDN
jgi:hypothetical protein